MARCWHVWFALLSRRGWFRCQKCLALAACPTCLGLGSQGYPPGGALVRYCDRHLSQCQGVC